MTRTVKFASVLCAILLNSHFGAGRSVENGRILHGNGWERQPVVEVAPQHNLTQFQIDPNFEKVNEHPQQFPIVDKVDLVNGPPVQLLLEFQPPQQQQHQQQVQQQQSDNFGSFVSENQPATYLLPPPPMTPSSPSFGQNSNVNPIPNPNLIQNPVPSQSQIFQVEPLQPQQPNHHHHHLQQQQPQFEQGRPTSENIVHINHNNNGGFIPIIRVQNSGNNKGNHTFNVNNAQYVNHIDPNAERLTQNLNNWLINLQTNVTTSTPAPSLSAPTSANVAVAEYYKEKGSGSSFSNRINTISAESQVNLNNHKLTPEGPVSGSSSGSVTPPGQKLRRKVNIEKFRECIFFSLCEKSQCFHFGRFGVCTKS